MSLAHFECLRDSAQKLLTERIAAKELVTLSLEFDTFVSPGVFAFQSIHSFGSYRTCWSLYPHYFAYLDHSGRKFVSITDPSLASDRPQQSSLLI